MSITLCFTALHIAQPGTGLLPFSGEQPLPLQRPRVLFANEMITPTI